MATGRRATNRPAVIAFLALFVCADLYALFRMAFVWMFDDPKPGQPFWTHEVWVALFVASCIATLFAFFWVSGSLFLRTLICASPALIALAGFALLRF